jgi:hypothetical protein
MDALGTSSNIQIQKTGASVICQPNVLLPASDLERWADGRRFVAPWTTACADGSWYTLFWKVY